MITTFNKFLMAMVLLTTVTLSSCKKDKFDEPPHTITDPNIANATIADLRALFSGGNPITVTDDIIIGGVVTADDRSGNFYKQFVIQDSTGAIPVLVNKSGLYTDYPVGRKIYIKCKGLVLGTYHNYVQLGGYVDNSSGQPSVGNIQSASAQNYIVKGPMVEPLVPITVTYDDLNNSYQAMLVKIENTEFASTDVDKPYADIINQQSLSRILNFCGNSNKIEVRTSNFALFSNAKTAKGNGSIIGIYSVYNSSYQLTIRDTSEVDLRGIRCDGTNPNAITLLSEDFETLPSGSNNATLNISGWKNITEMNTALWQNALFGSVKCAKIDSYNATSGQIVSWFISPQVNLGSYATKSLNFSFAPGKCDGVSSLTVLISTDYDGGTSPQNFTWNQLTQIVSTTPTGNNYGTIAPYGAIDLSTYSGNVYIAFKYDAAKSGTQQKTVYEIDDIKVLGL